MATNSLTTVRRCRKRTFVMDTQGRLRVADVEAAHQAAGALAVGVVSGVLWRCGERLEKVVGERGLQRRVCR